MTSSPAPSVVRAVNVWLTVLFIASRVAVLLWLSGFGSDLALHRTYWAQIRGGQVPFQDFFPEYPPLVFLYTGVPAVLDWSLEHYFVGFRMLTCFCDVIVWLMLLRMNRGQPAANLLYVICTTALGPLLYDRVDLALGAILLAAFAFRRRGRERTFQVCVGTGIAFKLIPLVWVPAILITACRGHWKRGLAAALFLALPLLLSMDVMAMLGGTHFERLIQFHLQRGLQIESVPASAEMLLVACGMPGTVTSEFGSANLHTPAEGGLRVASSIALIGVVSAGAAMSAMRRYRGAAETLLVSILAWSILSSKVLSPQYLLFLLPLLVVLPEPADVGAKVWRWSVIGAAYGLTAAIFPWNYHSVMRLELAGGLLIVLRNACLLLLAVSLFVQLRRGFPADRAGRPGNGGSAPLQHRGSSVGNPGSRPGRRIEECGMLTRAGENRRKCHR